jgi:hypothetical protein
MRSRKAKDAMGLPQGWWPGPFLWIWLACTVVAVILWALAADYWGEYRKLGLMVQLDQRDPEQLSVGEAVWGDGVIGDSTPIQLVHDPDHNENLVDSHSYAIKWILENNMVFGCKQTYDSSGKDKSWSTSHYFSPASMAMKDGDLEFGVFLDEACPEGEYKEVESGRSRLKGYLKGQEFAFQGTVLEVDPLEIEANDHRGGSAVEYRWTFQDNANGWMAAGGAVSAVCATMLMWSLLGISRRPQWTRFAYFNGLDTPGRSHMGLGYILGEHKGRQVHFRRRRGLGDGVMLPADVCLEVGLNPCMQGYKMRPQVTQGPWLKLTGEAEIDDPIMDRLFVLQGVDETRWRQLLSEKEVNDRLSDLSSDGVSVRMDRGTLELRWPGLGTGAMAAMLKRAYDLADAMEGSEGRAWQAAADALCLHFEHSSEGWSLRESERRTPLLKYALEDPNRLIMTRKWITSMEAAVDTPLEWVIEANTSGAGQRTGDPVLDAQVCFRGFEETTLAELLSSEDATETVMAAICGHGINLKSGVLRATTPGLLLDPTELVTDARNLQVLLCPGVIE